MQKDSFGTLSGDERFVVNSRKRRLCGPSSRRKVTGLVLGELNIGIGRHKLRELRSAFMHLARNAASDDSSESLLRLRGYLAFVRSVDRQSFRRLVRYIRKLQEKYPKSPIMEIKLSARDIEASSAPPNSYAT